MAAANIDMQILRADQGPRREPGEEAPPVRQYRADVVLPGVKGPLDDLLKKQPAVLGSLQMVSGFLTVGIGIFFAVTQNMTDSLLTMFRVSHLTGALFFFAGTISNLLFKYPELVSVSLSMNCGCILVAVIGSCLIGVDLAQWDPAHDQHLRMEALVLCVIGLEVFLSVVLCFWFFRERRAKAA